MVIGMLTIVIVFQTALLSVSWAPPSDLAGVLGYLFLYPQGMGYSGVFKISIAYVLLTGS